METTICCSRCGKETATPINIANSLYCGPCSRVAANAPVPETTPADGWGSLAGAPLVIAGWTLFVLMAVVWVAVEIDARSRTQLAHHEYEGLLFWLAIPMVMLGRSISRLDITLRRLIR